MPTKDEKKAKVSGNANTKSRMKVFIAGFEMEGDDAVMAEGFKAIRELSHAISRNTVLPPAVVSKPALGTAKIETFPAEMAADMEGSPAEAAVEDVETAEETTSGTNGSGQKRSYSYKTPQFLDGLDFGKAKKPLKEFIAEKNPAEVTGKYLVAVYWLQKYMDVAEVSIDHVYTVFDTLGWKTEMPQNPSVPLRDLKSKKHMLTREPGAEGYKLNFKGEQEVEKMGATK